jgi:hypothetical protein
MDLQLQNRHHREDNDRRMKKSRLMKTRGWQGGKKKKQVVDLHDLESRASHILNKKKLVKKKRKSKPFPPKSNQFLRTSYYTYM